LEDVIPDEEAVLSDKEAVPSDKEDELIGEEAVHPDV
jgi:hypothetical protein